jgi:hypothetical protein
MANEYEHKYVIMGKPRFIFRDDKAVSVYDIQLLGISHIEQFYINVLSPNGENIYKY